MNHPKHKLRIGLAAMLLACLCWNVNITFGMKKAEDKPDKNDEGKGILQAVRFCSQQCS